MQEPEKGLCPGLGLDSAGTRVRAMTGLGLDSAGTRERTVARIRARYCRDQSKGCGQD